MRGEDGGEGHVRVQIEGYHSKRCICLHIVTPCRTWSIPRETASPLPHIERYPFGHEGQGRALLFTPHFITSLYLSPCQRRVYRTKFSAFSIFSIILSSSFSTSPSNYNTEMDTYYFLNAITHARTHTVYTNKNKYI